MQDFFGEMALDVVEYYGGQPITEWRKKNPRKDFIAILNAEAGELQFRSRLWELWKEKAEKNEKEWS